ncbi:glycosyltransferase [Mycolicibacterium tokaiense]|uniref:4,4'-diaponeurosporenoate glycosyltransferase n=1 Tax=Mycolicibacterium tokaiense TaxID=39695 RepID=A0A378TEC5_9MYCO|nr:glycosyltransferase family 2 protein [Mycolicibacterium tokaiense]BBY87261.1 glycosyl transferase [Mycolicibacterium tokaiense]STZ58225.1 glycosyl transferase [Mycolicibacterium tokaiense]
MSLFSGAGVVIPAHNEKANLPRTLRAVITAAAGALIPVHIVVVLDNCDDNSEQLAAMFGTQVHFVTVDAGNVGAARAAGFSYVRSLGTTDEDMWYATTDADTRVDPDWLIRQLDVCSSEGADMVLGVVRIADWRRLPVAVLRRYVRGYESKSDHVHGANMGFRADAYWKVGGFQPLRSKEDVDLVQRFTAAGLRVRHEPKLSVATSARPQGRAPGGFAAHLRSLNKDSA